MPDAPLPLDASLARYSRQMILPEIGVAGQRRLLDSRVTLVGCGALGTVLANTLVRAGIGYVRICDRDFIEPNNLQRQILFDEKDIADGLPKAEAAGRKLRRINSDVHVESVVADVNHQNIEQLCEDAGLLLDGTDNFETRYLINDLAVSSDRPWIYGAVVGTSGLCMPVIPARTPCLRCIFPDPPPADVNPTCDTAGVLSMGVNVVAAFQATEAFKILLGREDEIINGLANIDIWAGRVSTMRATRENVSIDCPCCAKREFEYLNGAHVSATTSLCGRNAVQVNPAGAEAVNLVAIADRLRKSEIGTVHANEFMIRFNIGEYELTVFQDGRAIIKGTEDIEKARSVYARYIGI